MKGSSSSRSAILLDLECLAQLGRSTSGSSDGNSRGGEKAAREHMLLLLPISESQMAEMQNLMDNFAVIDPIGSASENVF